MNNNEEKYKSLAHKWKQMNEYKKNKRKQIINGEDNDVITQHK